MQLIQDIFSIDSPGDFERTAIEVFGYQYNNNSLYRTFCDLLHKGPEKVRSLGDIPFLPIEFFKYHQVLSGNEPSEIVFTSSGTTGQQTSKHHITDISVYQKSFRKAFSLFYGNPEEYTILALLPSYLEREGSSLVFMVQDLIRSSQSKESGFYLDNLAALKENLLQLEKEKKKVLLIGVSFALLKLAEDFPIALQNTLVMETGGMKGRRKEIIREELHQILSHGLGVKTIHSEYGMTELLSQAYSMGNGKFSCPPWMQVLIRDPEDPLQLFPNGKTGGINVIDLANIHSCSFIATQDLGKKQDSGAFEVLGRFDSSDIRGCNLLAL